MSKLFPWVLSYVPFLLVLLNGGQSGTPGMQTAHTEAPCRIIISQGRFDCNFLAMVSNACPAWLLMTPGETKTWFHDNQEGFIFSAYLCEAEQTIPYFSTISIIQMRKAMLMSLGVQVHICACVLFWCCFITHASLSWPLGVDSETASSVLDRYGTYCTEHSVLMHHSTVFIIYMHTCHSANMQTCWKSLERSRAAEHSLRRTCVT